MLRVAVFSLLVNLGSSLGAQQQTAMLFESASQTGVQEMFYKNDAVLNTIDSHIYSCGSTLNSNGTYDILITKHNGSNVLIWSVTYSGSGNYHDYASKITFDTSGNILVVGSSQISSNDYDGVVLKYEPDGDLIWSQTYNGTGNGLDGFTAVLTDASKNVYVGGGSYEGLSSLTDMLLIKYDSSGTSLYTKKWNNSTYNLQESAFRLLLSGSSVYIYGASQTSLSPVQWKLASAHYNQSTGNLVGSSTSYGDNDEFTEVADILPIGSNNLIVAGYVNVSGQGKNLKVTRFNQELTSTWDYTYNGAANGDDAATSLEISGGWLYAGGYTTLSDGTKDLFITKRNHTSGSSQWAVALDISGEDDEVIDLAGTSGGDIYVSGNSNKLGKSDFLLAKLNTSTGAIIASGRWGGQAAENDKVSNMVVSNTGEIYIAGQRGISASTYEFTMNKWSDRILYVPVPSDGYSSHAGYIQNNGQLRNEDGTANTSVKFYSQSHRVATYLDDSKISYQLIQARDTTNQDTTCRVDMTYSKGLSGSKIYGHNMRAEYHNYYLGHMSAPSVQTGIYNTIVKYEVYTNIDAIFTHSPGGFRHWLVARSGSTPSSFELSFDGQTGLSVDGSGKLIIATNIGNIVYTKAKVYTLNHTTGALTVLGWQPSYNISGSSVSFTSFGSWTGTLVIEFGEEPTASQMPPASNDNLEWSTFFGNNGYEINMDVANNSSGEVWYAGFANHGILLDAPGQNNTVAFDLSNIYVAKFDHSCEGEWITFYGSEGEDRTWAIDIDENGNSYCVGYWGSEDGVNFSNLGNSNDSEVNGYSDGFIIRLDNIGQITMDSYISGEGHDYAYDIAYRPANGIEAAALFIVGECEDPDEFPIVYSGNPAAYDQAHAGNRDGYIMHLNLSGTILWSSFIGGTGDDRSYRVESVAGNPVVIGVTQTSSYGDVNCSEPTNGGFPTCYLGGTFHQSGFTATNKWYIVRFNEKREMIHSTYFGPAFDLDDFTFPSITANHNEFDNSNPHNYYISGSSPSSLYTNFPTQNWPNTYDDPYALNFNSSMSGYKSWIAKFEVNGDYTKLIGNTLVDWDGSVGMLRLEEDSELNLIVTGQSSIESVQSALDYCTIPDPEEFPICDGNNNLYIENNTVSGTRSFIIQFDQEMGIKWSTQFGTNASNYVNCISSSGDYIFIGGNSINSYTLWEYDELSPDDYYRPTILGSAFDATITRFEKPDVALGNEETETIDDVGFVVFPSPATDRIWVNIPNALGSLITMDIYDSKGSLIYSRNNLFQNQLIDIPIDHWSSGIYSVRLSNNTLYKSINFVKL